MRIVINQSKLDALIASSTSAAVGRACEATAARVRRNIVSGDHIVTGELLNSIHHFIDRSDGNGSVGYVGSPLKQAAFLEKGRGPVAPLHARVLRFKIKGGPVIFTDYAGPAEATGFLSRTLTELRPSDFA